MRVAYRESIVSSETREVKFEKVIGGAHMFAQLKIQVESMIDEIDMAEVQRKKFQSQKEE